METQTSGKRTYTRRTIAEQEAELRQRLSRLEEAKAKGIGTPVNLDDPATVALRALATACSRAIRYGSALGVSGNGAGIAQCGRETLEIVQRVAKLHGIGLPDPETKKGRPVAFLKMEGKAN